MGRHLIDEEYEKEPIELHLVSAARPCWHRQLRAEPSGAKTNAFFPFCIDWHDAKKRNLEQQAAVLKELGYDGVGHIWLDNIPERLKTLDAAGLKLFQITMTVDITPGKQAYDPKFKEVMPLLKGRGVQFLLLMNGMKPSDPAGDARAVEIIREMAALAARVRARKYCCIRIASNVDGEDRGRRPRGGQGGPPERGRDVQPLPLAAGEQETATTSRCWPRRCRGCGRSRSMARTNLTTSPAGHHYIQPLGRGSFDMLAFLKTLRRLGYTGPIGLQCYGIQGDERDTWPSP